MANLLGGDTEGKFIVALITIHPPLYIAHIKAKLEQQQAKQREQEIQPQNNNSPDKANEPGKTYKQSEDYILYAGDTDLLLQD